MSNSVIVETSTLLARAGFLHGFSRVGVDFAPSRGAESVARDLARVGEVVGFTPERCHQVKQVHGAVTHVVTPTAPTADLEGDALVARGAALGSGLAVGVRTADCVPVLVGHPGSGAVAAIHAGWRGVEAGVVGAALGALRSDPRDARMVAAIGPSIGACCFEVTVEIADLLAQASGGHAGVVVARYGAGKAKVDLRAAVRAQLVAAGLADADIEDIGGCSVCTRAAAPTAEVAPHLYHSFRRDSAASGRMLAVIVAAAPR